MNKFPHNKYYYLLSMLVLGVPSVLGALWSRRKDIRYAPCFYYSFSREGIPLFDNYLQIQGKSRAAAQKATSEVFFYSIVLWYRFVLLALCWVLLNSLCHCCASDLLSDDITCSFTHSKRIYSLLVFSHPIHSHWLELCFLCGLFLSSASCAIFMPFGTLKKGTYVDNEGKTVSVDPQESNYFFKGL